jgi:hypothetical protein
MNPQKVSLGSNHLGNKNAPKLIIRQVGKSDFYFYFPESEKVYVSSNISPSLLELFEPSLITFLFEPGGSFIEPLKTCKYV